PSSSLSDPDISYWFQSVAPDTAHDAAIPQGKLTTDNFLDGLELLCEISVAEETGAAVNVPPATLATFENLETAGNYLQSLATGMVDRASRMVFAQIPGIALDANRTNSSFGAFPSLGGKMAEQVSTLRGAFLQAQTALPLMAGEINQFGAELKALKAQIEKD